MSAEHDSRVPPEFFEDETSTAPTLNAIADKVRRQYPVMLTWSERSALYNVFDRFTPLTPLYTPKKIVDGVAEGYAPSDVAALLWEIKLKIIGDRVARKLLTGT